MVVYRIGKVVHRRRGAAAGKAARVRIARGRRTTVRTVVRTQTGRRYTKTRRYIRCGSAARPRAR